MAGIQEQLMLLVVMQAFHHKVIYNYVCVFYFLLRTFLTDVIRKFVYNTSLSVHSARFNCRGSERSLLDCEIQSSYCSQYSAGHVTCLS